MCKSSLACSVTFAVYAFTAIQAFYQSCNLHIFVRFNLSFISPRHKFNDFNQDPCPYLLPRIQSTFSVKHPIKSFCQTSCQHFLQGNPFNIFCQASIQQFLSGIYSTVYVRQIVNSFCQASIQQFLSHTQSTISANHSVNSFCRASSQQFMSGIYSTVYVRQIVNNFCQASNHGLCQASILPGI